MCFSSYTVTTPNQGSPINITVDISSPTAAADFVPDTHTITFPVSPDASTVCTSFVILDDTIALEGNEQFYVNFTAPAEVQRGFTDTACVTIVDDDGTKYLL